MTAGRSPRGSPWLTLLLAASAAANTLDVIGRDVGLSRGQAVEASEGARILRDAEDGRADNL